MPRFVRFAMALCRPERQEAGKVFSAVKMACVERRMYMREQNGGRKKLKNAVFVRKIKTGKRLKKCDWARSMPQCLLNKVCDKYFYGAICT